jgi:hypothetical protein
MTDVKPDYEEQQCHYCKYWYPHPVAYYHDEAECLANQKVEAKEAVCT